VDPAAAQQEPAAASPEDGAGGTIPAKGEPSGQPQTDGHGRSDDEGSRRRHDHHGPEKGTLRYWLVKNIFEHPLFEGILLFLIMCDVGVVLSQMLLDNVLSIPGTETSFEPGAGFELIYNWKTHQLFYAGDPGPHYTELMAELEAEAEEGVVRQPNNSSSLLELRQRGRFRPLEHDAAWSAGAVDTQPHPVPQTKAVPPERVGSDSLGLSTPPVAPAWKDEKISQNSDRRTASLFPAPTTPALSFLDADGDVRNSRGQSTAGPRLETKSAGDTFTSVRRRPLRLLQSEKGDSTASTSFTANRKIKPQQLPPAARHASREPFSGSDDHDEFDAASPRAARIRSNVGTARGSAFAATSARNATAANSSTTASNATSQEPPLTGGNLSGRNNVELYFGQATEVPPDAVTGSEADLVRAEVYQAWHDGHILHTIGKVLISLFMVELLAHVYCHGLTHHFLHANSRLLLLGHWLDAVVIPTAFATEWFFHETAGQTKYITVVRLWRVLKILAGETAMAGEMINSKIETKRKEQRRFDKFLAEKSSEGLEGGEEILKQWREAEAKRKENERNGIYQEESDESSAEEEEHH